MSKSETQTPGANLAHLLNSNAYDLAALAAQLMCRQSSAKNAVETAWELIEAAKDKLEEVELLTPENIAAWCAEREKERAEYLAKLRIPYEKGVHLITGIEDRWSGQYGALNWFKKFLQWKAAKQEQTPDKTEARAEAWVANYRQKGFTGTEAPKLQDEFKQWRNKGKQGRVKKKTCDGRLREQRQKRAKKAADAAWKELIGPRQRTKPELESVPRYGHCSG
jgi:hypothetical protein